MSRVGPSKSTSWSHEIESVAATWPRRSSRGRQAVGHQAGPLGLGDELVGRVVAPVVEGAEQDAVRPVRTTSVTGRRWSKRHLGRGDDDPRVRADRPTEAQHAAVAVDQADAGRLGVEHRRQLLLDHQVDLVDGPGGGQRLGHVGRATDHAGRPAGGLVVGSRPTEEQDEPGHQQDGERRDRELQAPIDVAAVLHLHGPRSSADVDARDGRPRTADRSVAARTSSPSLTVNRLPGRERVAHHVGQVGARRRRW